MYLADSSAIITPFHRGQLEALSVALRHRTADETREWLEQWYEKGFSCGELVISREVYGEVLRGKRDRAERRLLKRLRELGRITLLQPSEECYEVLQEVDRFVRGNYEEYQARRFLRDPDAMLVALAKVHGATLITEERHILAERDGVRGVIQGEPRLPFIAGAFEVKCLPLLSVLITESWE